MSERTESAIFVFILSMILGVIVTITYLHAKRTNDTSDQACAQLSVGKITVKTVNGWIAQPKMVEMVQRAPKSHEKVIEKLSSYITKVNRQVDRATSRELSRHIVEASKAEKIDLPLFVALIKTESAFETGVTSRSNAQGLTQVIPRWHEDTMDKVRLRLGMSQDEVSLYHPRFNLHVGANVLKQFIKLQGGDITLGLLGYNGSLKDPDQKYAVKVLATAENIQRFLEAA